MNGASAVALGVAGGGVLSVGGIVVVERAVDGIDAVARRPAVVAVGALAGGVMGWRFAGDAVLPAYVALAATLTVLSAVDFATHRLPVRLFYPGALLSSLLLAGGALAGGSTGRLGPAVAGAVVAGLAFFGLHAAAPAALGFGDVRLAVLLGGFLAFVGAGVVVTGFLLGFGLAAVVAVGLLATRRAGLRTALPFGPFLSAGALAAIALSPHPF